MHTRSVQLIKAKILDSDKLKKFIYLNPKEDIEYSTDGTIFSVSTHLLYNLFIIEYYSTFVLFLAKIFIFHCVGNEQQQNGS